MYLYFRISSLSIGWHWLVHRGMEFQLKIIMCKCIRYKMNANAPMQTSYWFSHSFGNLFTALLMFILVIKFISLFPISSFLSLPHSFRILIWPNKCDLFGMCFHLSRTWFTYCCVLALSIYRLYLCSYFFVASPFSLRLMRSEWMGRSNDTQTHKCHCIQNARHKYNPYNINTQRYAWQLTDFTQLNWTGVFFPHHWPQRGHCLAFGYKRDKSLLTGWNGWHSSRLDNSKSVIRITITIEIDFGRLSWFQKLQ